MHSVADIADHPFLPHNLRLFLTEIDLFLIGATLIIAAIGLYELFIARIDPANSHRPLPDWLVMNDLNDLKARVIAMIILVSAVTFTDVLLEFSATSWTCCTWPRASGSSSSRSPSTSGSAPTTVVITHDGRDSPASPLRVTAQVHVRADPHDVWNLMTDWSRQHEWIWATQVRGGQGLGATVVGWTGIGPFGFTDTMIISEWDPPLRCVVRHTGPMVRGSGIFEVIPVGEECRLPLDRGTGTAPAARDGQAGRAGHPAHRRAGPGLVAAPVRPPGLAPGKAVGAPRPLDTPGRPAYP